jgi:1-acyl-sn-glycerol-3-phosphate acyltransferase
MLVHPIYRTVVFIAKMMFYELFDGNIYGDEHVPRHGPCLIACNHLSFLDPPCIGSAVHCREVFSIARKTLFRTKFRSWLFGNMNCIPLRREEGDVGAIRRALQLLRDGKCLMIFPEGTRSHDGHTSSYRAGVGLLACKTKIPVIPCKIFGTFDIMQRGSKFFDWNKKAQIVFGQPLLPRDYMDSGSSHWSHKRAAETIMAAMENLRVPRFFPL